MFLDQTYDIDLPDPAEDLGAELLVEGLELDVSCAVWLSVLLCKVACIGVGSGSIAIGARSVCS